MKITTMAGIVMISLFTSCNKNLMTYEQGDIRIQVKKGSAWLHDFPLFRGIKIKNPPQIAIWTEDPAGNYLSTLYVSHKIATASWSLNKGNRRKEALPVWCHARGVQYPDGLYLPTKDQPLADGISGATPRNSFEVKTRPAGDLRQFILKIEVNHSTDWNDSYPKNAKEGNPDYSGGKEGSGQPALVYAAEIDLDSNQKQYVALLTGHSSPDGSNGDIYPDSSSLTTALNIVKEIIISLQ